MWVPKGKYMREAEGPEWSPFDSVGMARGAAQVRYNVGEVLRGAQFR